MSDSGTYEYDYHAPSDKPQHGHLTTDFAMGKDMDQMKSMVSKGNPEAVREVASGWKSVHDQLVGDGGIQATFQAAVDHILQSWQGDAADGFSAQATTITKKLTDGAQYAHYTATAMESAATALAHIKPQVQAMQKPSETSSLLDHGKDILTGGGRDDSGLKTSIAKGASTQDALDSNRGDLSKGKEAQLEMAVKMEELAVAYSAQSKTMGSWTKRKPGLDDEQDYPGDPGGTAPVAFVPVVVESPSANTSSSRVIARTSTGSSSKSGTSSPSKSVTGSHESGVSGGVRQPATNPTKPQVGTGLDGFSGSQGGGSGTGGGTSGIGSAARGTTGGGSGSGAFGSTPGGFGGVTGSSVASGSGTAGRTGAGGRGMPGGSGSGTGGSGASKSGTGKGSIARQRGGVIDEAKGGAGKGSQGGSGLHKSRGGKDAGKVGKGSSRLGGRGVNTDAEEEEARQSKRPDYLVEDEETWVPERDVAPRVIE